MASRASVVAGRHRGHGSSTTPQPVVVSVSVICTCGANGCTIAFAAAALRQARSFWNSFVRLRQAAGSRTANGRDTLGVGAGAMCATSLMHM